MTTTDFHSRQAPRVYQPDPPGLGGERDAVSRAVGEGRPHRVLGTPGEPALLRPGHEVVLVQLSATEALVQSPRRMKPGTRTELLRVTNPEQRALGGVIAVCRVSNLAPLRYEGRIVFDDPGGEHRDAHVGESAACASVALG